MTDRAKSRDRKRPLKVVVNAEERQTIEDKAASTGLSVSAYLREVGMGYQPKSNFDQEAIMALMSLNADQGRLGGLLKLWLSEKPGQGASVSSVREVLGQIESFQQLLARHLYEEAKRL